MSIFSNAVNGFTSTMSRAGKYVNSSGAVRARRLAGRVARTSVTGSGAAALIGGSATVGLVGGAAVDKDNRMRGAIRGAAVGALGGAAYRVGTSYAMRAIAARGTTKYGPAAIRKGASLISRAADYVAP